MRTVNWDLVEKGVAEIQYLIHPRTQRGLTPEEKDRYMHLYAKLYDIAQAVLVDDEGDSNGLSIWDFTPQKWAEAIHRWQKRK